MRGSAVLLRRLIGDFIFECHYGFWFCAIENTEGWIFHDVAYIMFIVCLLV